MEVQLLLDSISSWFPKRLAAKKKSSTLKRYERCTKSWKKVNFEFAKIGNKGKDNDEIKGISLRMSCFSYIFPKVKINVGSFLSTSLLPLNFRLLCRLIKFVHKANKQQKKNIQWWGFHDCLFVSLVEERKTKQSSFL